MSAFMVTGVVPLELEYDDGVRSPMISPHPDSRAHPRFRRTTRPKKRGKTKEGSNHEVPDARKDSKNDCISEMDMMVR